MQDRSIIIITKKKSGKCMLKVSSIYLQDKNILDFNADQIPEESTEEKS